MYIWYTVSNLLFEICLTPSKYDCNGCSTLIQLMTRILHPMHTVPEPLSKDVVNVDVTVDNSKDIEITVSIQLRNHKVSINKY